MVNNDVCREGVGEKQEDDKGNREGKVKQERKRRENMR